MYQFAFILCSLCVILCYFVLLCVTLCYFALLCVTLRKIALAVKMADLELLDYPKLISRKIWMTEKILKISHCVFAQCYIYLGNLHDLHFFRFLCTNTMKMAADGSVLKVLWQSMTAFTTLHLRQTLDEVTNYSPSLPTKISESFQWKNQQMNSQIDLLLTKLQNTR